MVLLVTLVLGLTQPQSLPPAQVLDCSTGDGSLALPESPQQQALFGESYCTTLTRLRPVRVGGTLPSPVKVKDVRPAYPAEAQNSGAQGIVIVEAIVGPDGKVANARIIRGIDLLNASSLDVVSKWEYRPVLLNGNPVSFVMTVTVNYWLQ